MEYELLRDVCTINMGQSPKSISYNDSGIGLPFFQGNADFGEKYPIARKWCSEPIKIAKPNDILISVRAPIGALNYVDENCCIGRGLAALTVNEKMVLPQFIYWVLKGKTEELNEMGTGSTFKAIGRTVLEEIKIPKMSINRQAQIIFALENVYKQISMRGRMLEYFDNLIKARFVEMFLDKGYPVLPWNDVFNTTTGKIDSNAMVEDGKYPFFTCAKEVFRIDKYAFDQEALLLAGNNAAGKYDVKYYKGKFNAYQRTYVLGLKQKWSYRLFQNQLEEKLVYLQQKSLGGLTKYLTMKILGELSFIIPPIDKQIEFEQFVIQVDKSRFV
ncbi:restriction endonuclease subunit S [Sharpea porci]|nr:restriction endonuclease subunit S [Sharpea porci]MDY5278763.1 restriction endonuclease subunit S [Sharpea porci]